MKGVTIRPLAMEDAEGLLAHWIDIASEPGIYVSYTPDEANIPAEKQRDRIKKDIEEGNLCLVAEAGGTIIAHLGCVVERPFSLTRHTATLGMSVDRRFRNQGTGAGLLERAIAWVEEQGIVRLQLEVYAENSSAIRLYEKFGFEVEGRKRMYAYQRGRYYDSLIMSRLFIK